METDPVSETCFLFFLEYQMMERVKKPSSSVCPSSSSSSSSSLLLFLKWFAQVQPRAYALGVTMMCSHITHHINPETVSKNNGYLVHLRSPKESSLWHLLEIVWLFISEWVGGQLTATEHL
jgi:hypothetical protein